MIAFLRAVNVGRRQVPMARLRERLDAAGFGPSETYIQTGNVRVAGGDGAALEAALGEWFGFEIPVVWFGEAELVSLVAAAPASPLPETKNHYVSLLAAAPSGDRLDRDLAALGRADEAGVRVGRAVHLFYGGDVHAARLSNAWVERRAGVATARSIKVLRTLAQRWG